MIGEYMSFGKIELELYDSIEISKLLLNYDVMLDMIRTMCGKQIGAGAFRDVYDYNLDSKYVIKIERGNTDCNIVEYMLWNEIMGLEGDLAWVKNWFAPIWWISPNNKILIMKKTKDISSKKKPDRIPAFMWDVKNSNFGWIGNKYVCHDYGQFYNFINYSKKMRKVIW